MSSEEREAETDVDVVIEDPDAAGAARGDGAAVCAASAPTRSAASDGEPITIQPRMGIHVPSAGGAKGSTPGDADPKEGLAVDDEVTTATVPRAELLRKVAAEAGAPRAVATNAGARPNRAKTVIGLAPPPPPVLDPREAETQERLRLGTLPLVEPNPEPLPNPPARELSNREEALTVNASAAAPSAAAPSGPPDVEIAAAAVGSEGRAGEARYAAKSRGPSVLGLVAGALAIALASGAAGWWLRGTSMPAAKLAVAAPLSGAPHAPAAAPEQKADIEPAKNPEPAKGNVDVDAAKDPEPAKGSVEVGADKKAESAASAPAKPKPRPLPKGKAPSPSKPAAVRPPPKAAGPAASGGFTPGGI